MQQRIRAKKEVKLWLSNFKEKWRRTLPAAADVMEEEQISWDKMGKAMVLRQDNVIGLEDQKHTLIECLKKESNELAVISIIGIPGIGKTTLAKAIYRDSRIQYEFPTLIWVNVSQNFRMKDVLLTILKRFTERDMSSLSVDDLKLQVQLYLVRGKYLIFMDDVWTVEAWEEIQSALPTGNKMGKVLITSHDYKMGAASSSESQLKLQLLNAADSWELLQLQVFGGVDEFPSELETVGKLIAEKCGGLPLAIMVIGGILVKKLGEFKDMKREWEMIITRLNSYDSNCKEVMENIISLSYSSYLPQELKHCFLYLGSMFPEDTEISASNLIRLWIAEGFVQQTPEKSMEQIAEEYLQELMERNLVMIDKLKAEGEIKSCRIHGMIRNFCQKEVKHDPHILYREFRCSENGCCESQVTEIQKGKRICIIHSNLSHFSMKKPNISKPRSFLCFSISPILVKKKDVTSITEAFELLRILDSTAIKFPKIPNYSKLIHITYLILSGNKFKILPKAISTLHQLQTLMVDTQSRVLKIKANIWKMKVLRHVKTKSLIILNNNVNGAGGGNLQAISRLSPKSCTSNVFNKAKYLKTLGIRGRLDNLDPTFLENLDHLVKLKLVNDASENPLCNIPQKFPPRLNNLTLSGTYLDWTYISELGKIGTLKVLKLKDNAFMGNRWNAVGGGFTCLQVLYIETADLKLWTTLNDPFPELRSLVIKNCRRLQGVPLDLGKKLEMLSLEHVTKYVVSSAKKMKHEKQGEGGFKLIIAPGDI